MRKKERKTKNAQGIIEIQINNEGDKESTEEENNHKNMKRFDNNQSLSQRLETHTQQNCVTIVNVYFLPA